MWIVGALVLGLGACERKPSPPATPSPTPTSPAAASDRAAPPAGSDPTPAATSGTAPAVVKVDHRRALLLAESILVQAPASTQAAKGVPAPRLVVLYPDATFEHWTTEHIDDTDGNVFHKAMPFDLPGEAPGVLTISGDKAPRPGVVKVWRRTADGWHGETLYEGRFGGEWNRLRDIEIGDVTGDGRPDMVIATHDRGVVVVLEKKDGAWHPTEIDRAIEQTFVHEIEIGDVDGDGRNEIFATPSEPNRAGHKQSGSVVMYRRDGDTFRREVVEAFEGRHPKEILVADVEKRGRPDLFAVVEVGTLATTAGAVEIKRYRLENGRWDSQIVATVPDTQCRCLSAGDLDHDGKDELVATAFRSGIWLIRPGPGLWQATRIEAGTVSAGFEHSHCIADIDGDGKQELYVAADSQKKLRRYMWNGESFDRTEVADLRDATFVWGVQACTDAKCLGR